MPKREDGVRLLALEPRLLLLFLAIGGPVFLVSALLILGWLRGEMNRTIGDDMLGGAAVHTARYLDTYLLNNLTNVSVIAATPSLRQAVETSNREYTGSAEVIRERLRRQDQEWVEKRGALVWALDIVVRDTSDFLREIATFNPAYDEILLTDRQGALVAATNLTTDYYQGDEEWWRSAFGDGEQGAFYMSGVIFDQSAGGHVLEMAVPVRDVAVPVGDVPSHEFPQVIGVLKVEVRATDLSSVISGVRPGETGHALLVDRRDGTVIIGSEAKDVMARKYPGFSRLEETMGGQERSFLTRDEEGTVWVAGFARMPEPSPSAYRDWVVLVQQEADEAHAAMRHATLYLLVFFVGIGGVILLMSLYLHWKLVRPIREIDLREEMERLGIAESEAR